MKYISCECGKLVSKNIYRKHLKTSYHFDLMKRTGKSRKNKILYPQIDDYDIEEENNNIKGNYII